MLFSIATNQDLFNQGRVSNTQPSVCMWPTNYIPLVRDGTVFVINIFLKFVSHVSPQIRLEYSLIFHWLSVQIQTQKSRNNSILYAFKKRS